MYYNVNIKQFVTFSVNKKTKAISMVKRPRGRPPGPAKRRRVMRRRVPRGVRMPMLALRRTFYFQNWPFGTNATGDFWRYYQFRLANIPNLVEYTGLFDLYKINGIKITFRPRYDNVSSVDAGTGLPSGAQPQAYLHYAVDPENTVVPAGLYNSATMNSFLETNGVKTRTLNKPVSIFFKPKIIVDNGLLRRPGWVRTNDTNLDHRGVHVFLQQNNFSSTNTQIQLDVFYTFYMQLKGLR